MRARALRPSTLYLSALIGGLGVLVLHTTVDFGGHGLDGFFDDGVYNALMLASAAAVLARGLLVRDEERTAWLVMGGGLLSWCAGELYYALLVEGTAAEAGGRITPADVLYLAMYPCFYVAIGLLARRHLRDVRAGIWLDGLIAGLGAASVAAALILPPILDHATGAHSSVVVSLAYPTGDLLLLAFALGAIGLNGWRRDGIWVLIAGGMLATAIADSIYLYETATDTFNPGSWAECLWPLAAILLAVAAWTPSRPPRARDGQSWQAMSVPALALLSALGVLVYGSLGARLTTSAVVLAAATVLAVGAHLLVTWRENVALLVHTRRLSLTDPLTGLGNRRRLMRDLHLTCKLADQRERWGLALYDLDGFKLFNDSFGHPAGDALLVRLSERLRLVVEPYGTAYRMGGDEFCVLYDRSHSQQTCDELMSASVAALVEQGPGFSITASHGVVRLPEETSDPAATLQLADQRLYRRKEELTAQRAAHATPASYAYNCQDDPRTALPSSDDAYDCEDDPRAALPSSADAYDCEDDLALGEGYGDALAGAAADQGARDRRVRR